MKKTWLYQKIKNKNFNKISKEIMIQSKKQMNKSLNLTIFEIIYLFLNKNKKFYKKLNLIKWQLLVDKLAVEKGYIFSYF